MNRTPTLALALGGNVAVIAAAWLLHWASTRAGLDGALLWPTGLAATAGVCLLGWTAAPAITLASFATAVAFEGAAPQTALAHALLDAGALVAAWTLLLRLRRPWRGMQTIGDTLAFIVCIGLLAPLASLGLPRLAGFAAPTQAPLLNELAGAVSGVLVFTTPLVLWWERRGQTLQRPRLESLLVPLLALVCTGWIYALPPLRQAPSMGVSTLALLPLLWVAMREPMRLSGLLLAVVCALALGGTLAGLGPMMALPPHERVVALQLMGIGLASTVLLAGSLAQERRVALRQLREANLGLERAVERRTAALLDTQSRLQQELRFQDALLGALPNPAAYTDREGRLALVNRAFCNLLERDRDALLGRPAEDVLDGPLGRTWREMDVALQAGGASSRECRQVGADGTTSVWIVNKARAIGPGGLETLGIVTSLQDITELKRLQERLERDEARLRFLLDESPVPMLLARLHDGSLLFSNRASDELLDSAGLRANAAAARPMHALWHDPAQREAVVADVLREGVVRAVELELHRLDGGTTWLLLSIAHTRYRDEEALLFAFKDITATKERERALQALANTDPLTGVANRRHFLSRAAGEIGDMIRLGQPLAVLALDIDHFKQLNDVYGHPMGDRALRSFAGVCQAQLRSADLLGRLGGDEFAIVLPHADGQRAYDFAQRLRLAVQETASQEHAPLRLQITTSIGIAEHAGDGAQLEELLARADQALYRAKQRGRNRVELWTAVDDLVV